MPSWAALSRNSGGAYRNNRTRLPRRGGLGAPLRSSCAYFAAAAPANRLAGTCSLRQSIDSPVPGADRTRRYRNMKLASMLGRITAVRRPGAHRARNVSKFPPNGTAMIAHATSVIRQRSPCNGAWLSGAKIVHSHTGKPASDGSSGLLRMGSIACRETALPVGWHQSTPSFGTEKWDARK